MDAKQEIKLTIFHLIYERGYDKTTYQTISDLSGYDKTLVQYHFPQKSLFMITFIDFLISVVTDFMEQNKMSSTESELEFILMSKIYSQLLLHREIKNNVTSKIVEDRKMLTKIQNIHMETATEILEVDEDMRNEFILLLSFAMGGHFDIIHRILNEEISYDTHSLITQTLLTIAPVLKLEKDDVFRIMDEAHSYDRQIHEIVEKIIHSLKSQLGIVSFD